MTIRAPFSSVTISRGSADPSLASDLNQGVTSFSDSNTALCVNREFECKETSAQPDNNLYENKTLRVSSPQQNILDQVQIKVEAGVPKSPQTETPDPVYENLKADQASHDHNHNKESAMTRSARTSDSPRKTSQSHEKVRRKQEVEKSSEQEVKNHHLPDSTKV